MSVVTVPPGEGSARTRRNNQSKRKKIRAKLNEEVHERFLQAVERSQQRANGELVDEDDMQGAYMVDFEGDAVEEDNTTTKRLSVSHHSIDLEACLPPGGGSLGLPPVTQAAAPIPAAAAIVTAATATAPQTPQQRKNRKHQPSSAAPLRKRIQPPSQRSDPIPPGLRLRRIECDECVTPWPDEENEQIPLKGIPGATGDAEIVADLREDDFTAMYAAMGLPVSFGKQQGWDGNNLLTSAALPGWEREGDIATEDFKSMKSRRSPATPTLDYGSAGEKQPLLPEKMPLQVQSPLPSAADVLATEKSSNTSAPPLDYGSPEGEQSTINASLQMLRRLYAERVSGAGASGEHGDAMSDLAKAREAALASLKVKEVS